MKRASWWLIGLGAVLAVVVSAWVTSRQQAYPGHLDPRNPTATGAQAVARVLADQGVEVEIVRDRESFDAAATGPGTVVVVTDTDHLGASTVADLRRHTDWTVNRSRLVVVEPGPRIVDLLQASGGTFSIGLGDPVDAGCEALAGLRLEVDQGTAYRPDSESCFSTEAGDLLTQPTPGLYLLGAGDLLSNHQVLRADNAAIALRLLGSADHLVWYVPSTDDLALADEVGIRPLLPTWLTPGLWVVVLTVLAMIVWRGRRLGRLAIEPLPVTVKAIEAAQSRARLYRKANDRAHAALSLRAAARARILVRLQLPPATGHEALVAALMAETDRTAPELHHLLYGAPPSSDRELITLATTLDELDDQLRKAPR